MDSTLRRVALAVGLFFLAPLVGEWLLGNQSIDALPYVLLLAPMYGGGALLIREVARRAGRGWATMIVLAMAYSLLEEGPIDQMFWNPAYGGYDIGLAYGGTYLPVIGTSAAMVQDVLMMHTIWSVCVPIAIMETFSRERTRPWLGPFGLGVTVVVFLAGSAFLAYEQAASFMASPGKLIGAAAVIVALIVAAFLIGRRPAAPVEREAPGWAVVALTSFAACTLYWVKQFLPESISPWLVSVGTLVLTAAFVVLFARWSRERDWGAAHRLALAGGALLTYAWLGFVNASEIGAPLIGQAVVAAGAVILLLLAIRHVRAGERVLVS